MRDAAPNVAPPGSTRSIGVPPMFSRRPAGSPTTAGAADTANVTGGTPMLLKRLRAEWPMKIWLGALLTLFVCAGYFGTQVVTLRPPVALPLTVIDRAVPFAPQWTFVYLSLYLLLATAWLATTRDQLCRYAAGMAAMAVVAFAAFVLFPVTGPRPTDRATGIGSGAYALLTKLDGPLNCFPSLHVALAVYAVCFVARVLREPAGTILPLPGTPGRGRGRGDGVAPTQAPSDSPIDLGIADRTIVNSTRPSPLSPTLSPEYREEGVKRDIHSRGFVTLLAAWAALIGYSTLATKQHYFVDAIFGGALGAIAYFVGLRAPRLWGTPPAPAPEAIR